MANKVTITESSRDISKAVSKMDPVQDALTKHSRKVADMAASLLAPHRKTGAHDIDYIGHWSEVQFGHIDHYVVMDGPAAVSVEFGHRTKEGEWVRGLYIMTRARLTR